jgi:hypothetical protein
LTGAGERLSGILTPAVLLAKEPEVTLTSSSKIARPSKGKREKLVWAKLLIHAAADVCLSDVALRKHCVKLRTPDLGRV